MLQKFAGDTKVGGIVSTEEDQNSVPEALDGLEDRKDKCDEMP